MVLSNPSALPSEDFAEYLPKKGQKDVIREVEHGLETSDKSVIKHFQKARYMNLRPDTWVNKKAMTKENFVNAAKKINNIVIDGQKIDLDNISDPYLLVKVLLSYLGYTGMYGNKLNVTKSSNRMADILPEQKDLYIALLKFQSLNINDSDKKQSAYSAKNKDAGDDGMADGTIGGLTLRGLIIDATEKQNKEILKKQEVEHVDEKTGEELASMKVDILNNDLDGGIKKLEIDFDAMEKRADFIMNGTFYYSKDNVSDLNDSDKPIDVAINDKITYLEGVYKEFDGVFADNQRQVVEKLIKSYKSLLDKVVSSEKEKQLNSREVSYIDSKIGKAWTKFEKSFDDSEFGFKDEKGKFRDNLKKSEFKQIWNHFVDFQSKLGDDGVELKPDINLYLWLNDIRNYFNIAGTTRYIKGLIRMYNPFFVKKESYDIVSDLVDSKILGIDENDYNEIIGFFESQGIRENVDTQSLDNVDDLVSWGGLSEQQKDIINNVIKNLVKNREITRQQYDDFKFIMIYERGLFGNNTFVGNTEYDKNSNGFTKVIDNGGDQNALDESIWLPAKQKELISVFEGKLGAPNLTAEELKKISADVVSKRKELSFLLSSEELKYKDLSPLPDHIVMLKSILSQYNHLEKKISVLAKEMLDNDK